MSQRIKSIFKKFRNIILFGHLDPIEYYVIDDLKLVYVENAKVACTSIKRVLYKVPEDIGMEIHEYLRPLAQMELKGAQLEYDIFTVVRNPFQRIVSCYQDKVLRLAEDKGRSIFDLLWYKFTFLIFSCKWYQGRKTSFPEFVDMISKTPDRFSDRHFRAQSRIFDGNNGVFLRIHVIKLESINEEWQWVEDKTGIMVPNSKVNSNRGNDWKKYYSDKAVFEKVQRRYSEDIQKFGYSDRYEEIIGINL